MKILKDYYEIFLIFIGLLISAGLIWMLAWSVLIIGKSMNQAFGVVMVDQGESSFMLDQAKMLDFKGLTE